MYRNLYNELDTKSKRCLIIDIYSILFIIVPTRYFLTKKRGSLWIIALLFLLGKVKGKEEVLLDDNKKNKISYKKIKYNMI